MFYWMLRKILKRGFRSKRGAIGIGQMENLARSDTAAWVLAQERARLEFLAVKEEHEKEQSWHSFQRVMERLFQLHSTNAVVQSLINEHMIEQFIHKPAGEAAQVETSPARRCA
jgi:hypothetical protein